MDVLVAIDAIDDFLHNAKRVPLSDDVRVRADELRASIERVRAELTAILPEPERSRSLPLVERMEEIARAAPSVPLTRDVRLDKERLYEILDQLRATVAQDMRPPGSPQVPHDDSRPPDAIPLTPRLQGAIEALETLLTRGGGRESLNPGTLSDAVTTLRGAVESGLEGFQRTRALDLVGQVEALAAAAKPRPLSSRVRVDAEAILDRLDMLAAIAATP